MVGAVDVCLILGPSGWQMFKDDSLGNHPGYLTRFSVLGMFLLGECMLDSGSCFAPLWSQRSIFIFLYAKLSSPGKWSYWTWFKMTPCWLQRRSPLPIGNCAFSVLPSVGAQLLPNEALFFLLVLLLPANASFSGMMSPEYPLIAGNTDQAPEVDLLKSILSRLRWRRLW